MSRADDVHRICAKLEALWRWRPTVQFGNLVSTLELRCEEDLPALPDADLEAALDRALRDLGVTVGEPQTTARYCLGDCEPGQPVMFDDDGCCVMCGADTKVGPLDASAAPVPREPACKTCNGTEDVGEDPFVFERCPDCRPPASPPSGVGTGEGEG